VAPREPLCGPQGGRGPRLRNPGLDSGKTLSEQHIHYKSLLTRVYDYAGRVVNGKHFSVALKMFDVFDKKQMCDSVFTGKENASKDWNCIISIFLMNFNIFFVFGIECLMCRLYICLKTAI